MTTINFSGTGNTEYIAKLFSYKMNCSCYSIEEKIDFTELFDSNETICFCYPIYGSRMPRIMREFLLKNIEILKNKKIIIFCTQLLFSGDGARSFVDLFPKNYFYVKYAEHFRMPSNVSNSKFFIFKVKNGNDTKIFITNANKKMDDVCNNIKNGVVKRRGFNVLSRILGLSQGAFMDGVEKKGLNSVKVNDDCVKCKICVSACPMKNLKLENNKITHNNNCILCYRCVNKCPKKAITAWINHEVIEQYKGVNYEKN